MSVCPIVEVQKKRVMRVIQLEDIKLTIEAAESISGKLDNMSDDFEQLMKDKELTKSIRDLTIGLSKFLNDIYP